MKTVRDQLSSILKTTQMGQIGIRSVLDTPMKDDIRNALASQLQEYDTIETEAHSIARRRNWEVKELSPSVRFMTDRMVQAQLLFGDRNSKISAMTIQGNMRGIIKGLKNSHRISEPDREISALSNKLLETEHRNIEQLKPYL